MTSSARKPPRNRPAPKGARAPAERAVSAETVWDQRWRRFGSWTNPLAAVALIVATVWVAGFGWNLQSAQADAVVMADRQNASLAAIADAQELYDRGGRLVALVDQHRQLGTPDAYSRLVAGGQEFDAAKQTAATSALAASVKSVGYQSADQFQSLEEYVSRAHLVVAIYYNLGPGDVAPRAEEEYAEERSEALAALGALRGATNNATKVSGCDFGYRNGQGAQGFAQCPLQPEPLPEIELPPGYTRGP